MKFKNANVLIIRFWQTVLPVKIFDFFFGKVFGIYHAMDDFQGRK